MKLPEYSERRATLERGPDGVRMSAALSSAEPVPMPFGLETLVHSPDAVDMSRAANGLPLLVNHARDSLPVGRVENIRLDGDRLRGELAFSDATEAAREAAALAQDGTLTDVSIRYRILDWERGDNDDEVTITRWMPVETSVVSVPADASVGIGRSLATEETVPMSDENTPETTVSKADAPSVLDTVRERSGAGYAAGREAERARLNGIRELSATMGRSLPDLSIQIEELAGYCSDDETIDVATFQRHLLELIGGAGHPVAVESGARSADGTGYRPASYAPSQSLAGERAPSPRHSAIRLPGATHRGLDFQPGADGMEQAARGMELSLLERAGATVTPDEMRGNQYRGWSMLDMARDCLELHGHSTRGWSSEQIARAAISMGQRAISPGTANYATTDFPAVTENVLTKRIHDAFAAAPVTWDRWCSSTEVPDFKQFTIPRLSQISDLPIVAENAAYTNLTQTDAKESATLVKHGGLMSFTWEAIVNDDQRMFQRTATSMGESAARVLDKKAYAVLTDNNLMGDGTALFAVGHGNLQATTPLDLAGIIKLRTAMARQTDDNSIELGIELRYILVPEELRDTADNLAGSEYLPWEEASPGAQRVNTVRSTFTVVPTIRLTDVNDWYAASGNGGTVEIAFLTGNRMPALMRDEGWDTDALHWKIRHPSVAYAVDWRGLQSATNV